MSDLAPPTTVEEYFVRLPADQQAALRHLRELITTAAPEVTERIAYGMPCFYRNGTSFLCIAAFKNHCSLFGIPSEIETLFADDLIEFKLSGKGTIQFTPDHPLPDDLVEKIIQARLKASH